MKIAIDTQTLNSLKVCLNAILMVQSRLYCVTELESVKEEREVIKPKTWLRKEKTETVVEYFITKLVIESVHSQGKFLGTLTDGAAKDFIRTYSIYRLRQNWLDIKNQIDLFGFTIVPKPETKEDTNSK